MQIINQFSLLSFKSTTKANSCQSNPSANSRQMEHLSINNSTNQFVSFKSKPPIIIKDEAQKIIEASSIIVTSASKPFSEIMQELKKRTQDEDTVLKILLETRKEAAKLSNLADSHMIPAQAVDEIAKLKLETKINNIEALLKISDIEFSRAFKANDIVNAALTKEQVGYGMEKIAKACKEINSKEISYMYPTLKIEDIQVALNKAVKKEKIDNKKAADIYKEYLLPVFTKQLSEKLDKMPPKKACYLYNNIFQTLQN